MTRMFEDPKAKQETIVWRFQINGTDQHPFGEYGLRFNPFPQHAKTELNACDLALQSLAEANMTPAEIQKRLEPHFAQVFIDSVIQHYQPNVIVDCEVTCKWEENNE